MVIINQKFIKNEDNINLQIKLDWVVNNERMHQWKKLFDIIL